MCFEGELLWFTDFNVVIKECLKHVWRLLLQRVDTYLLCVFLLLRVEHGCCILDEHTKLFEFLLFAQKVAVAKVLGLSVYLLQFLG